MRWLSILIIFLLTACEERNFPAQKTVVGASGNEILEDEATALKTVKSHKVESLNLKEFFVADRESKISQFACSNCHDKALPERQQGTFRHSFMHLDIEMNHAGTETMDCRSCHNEHNMDTLRMNDGSELSFNHSYKLCTQCHFQQGKDWHGGAHGKRLVSWRGKRVVMNCTECHNPHAPSFHQRFPKGRPTIPRTGGGH